MYESRDIQCYKRYVSHSVTLNLPVVAIHAVVIYNPRHLIRSFDFFISGKIINFQRNVTSHTNKLKNELTARDVRRHSCVDIAHWIKITKYKISF